MINKLILLLLVGLTFFVHAPASAAVAASVENRASGSARDLTTRVEIEVRLSEEAVREYVGLGYELASDFSVAARGTANTVTIVGRSAGAREAMWSGKKVTNELAEALGVDRTKLGDAIHSIKEAWGLRPNHNVTIGRVSGDVYDSKTGELLGNILDEVR